MLCEQCENIEATIECSECAAKEDFQPVRFCTECSKVVHMGKRMSRHVLTSILIKEETENLNFKVAEQEKCNACIQTRMDEVTAIRSDLDERQKTYERCIREKITDLQQCLKAKAVAIIGRLREQTELKKAQLARCNEIYSSNQSTCEANIQEMKSLLEQDGEKFLEGVKKIKEKILPLSCIGELITEFPVLDISFHMDLTQVKHDIEAVDCVIVFEGSSTAVDQQVVDTAPPVVKGAEVVGLIHSNLDKEGRFWFQPEMSEAAYKKIAVIGDDIRRAFYQSPHWMTYAESHQEPSVGDLVFAKYCVDQKWYRGRVEALDNGKKDQAAVRFIDFGNLEYVSFAQMLPYRDDVVTGDIPHQAVQVSLLREEFPLPLEARWLFGDHVKNQLVKCIFKEAFEADGEEPCWSVDVWSETEQEVTINEIIQLKAKTLSKPKDAIVSKDFRLADNPSLTSEIRIERGTDGGQEQHTSVSMQTQRSPSIAGLCGSSETSFVTVSSSVSPVSTPVVDCTPLPDCTPLLDCIPLLDCTSLTSVDPKRGSTDLNSQSCNSYKSEPIPCHDSHKPYGSSTASVGSHVVPEVPAGSRKANETMHLTGEPIRLLQNDLVQPASQPSPDGCDVAAISLDRMVQPTMRGLTRSMDDLQVGGSKHQLSETQLSADCDSLPSLATDCVLASRNGKVKKRKKKQKSKEDKSERTDSIEPLVHLSRGLDIDPSACVGDTGRREDSLSAGLIVTYDMFPHLASTPKYLEVGCEYGITVEQPLDDAGGFWAVFVMSREQEEEFDRYQKILDAHAVSANPARCLTLSDTYLAPYEGAWHRVKVESWDSTRATVRYMDYGNSLVLPRHQVKTLPKDLYTNVPFQAIKCCLNLTLDKTREMFSAFVLNKWLIAKTKTMICDDYSPSALVILRDKDTGDCFDGGSTRQCVGLAPPAVQLQQLNDLGGCQHDDMKTNSNSSVSMKANHWVEKNITCEASELMSDSACCIHSDAGNDNVQLSEQNCPVNLCESSSELTSNILVDVREPMSPEETGSKRDPLLVSTECLSGTSLTSMKENQDLALHLDGDRQEHDSREGATSQVEVIEGARLMEATSCDNLLTCSEVKPNDSDPFVCVLKQASRDMSDRKPHGLQTSDENADSQSVAGIPCMPTVSSVSMPTVSSISMPAAFTSNVRYPMSCQNEVASARSSFHPSRYSSSVNSDAAAPPPITVLQRPHFSPPGRGTVGLGHPRHFSALPYYPVPPQYLNRPVVPPCSAPRYVLPMTRVAADQSQRKVLSPVLDDFERMGQVHTKVERSSHDETILESIGHVENVEQGEDETGTDGEEKEWLCSGRSQLCTTPNEDHNIAAARPTAELRHDSLEPAESRLSPSPPGVSQVPSCYDDDAWKEGELDFLKPATVIPNVRRNSVPSRSGRPVEDACFNCREHGHYRAHCPYEAGGRRLKGRNGRLKFRR